MRSLNNIKKALYELEQRLQLPEIRRSPEDVSGLLCDDFIEFSSSGKIYDKAAIIAALAARPDAHFLMTDFKMMLLSAQIALVTYRTVSQTNGPLTHSLRSSIWKLTDDGWRILFHQGTTIKK